MRIWAFWRRMTYGFGLFTVLAILGGTFYYFHGYEEPTCVDTIQNGTESGVDCGGRCARMCLAEVEEPFVRWTRSFRVTDGIYNAVAYVENRNRTAGVERLGYTIRLFDKDGPITERRGETELPPNSLYPLFEGRIETGNRIPTQTVIEFAGEQIWLPATLKGDHLTIEERELLNTDTTPVLKARLRNDSLDEMRNVDVVATIFDAEGTALTTSRTTIEKFPGRSTSDITFTWREPIAKTLRNCSVPSDIVLALDLSGSMNNDGGDPPEPITGVLKAATNFVARLGETDQVGLVVYATEAFALAPLTSDHEYVRSIIGSLAIDPSEEQGSTNTGDALIRAQGEILSLRQNDAARKVVVLLTDGLATAPDENPEQHARDAAEALKAAGIQIYTIGLGQNLNEAFLTELATDPAHYLFAPTTEALEGIYASVTESICEVGAAVIEIVPKPSAIFTPIVL